jgi:glycerol kinase
MGKVTYGTSATANVHSGDHIRVIPGTYPLVLKRVNCAAEFCVEGMVITAGAVLDWLAGGIGLLDNPSESAQIGAEVDDTGGVSVLPAFQGLGSPYAEPERCGLIVGLTRSTRREHIARAMLEGIAFRVRDVLEAIYAGLEVARPEALRADGGAATNDLLMQLQADTLGCTVERMSPMEASAFGAALLAAQGVGLAGSDAARNWRKVDRVFEPRPSEDERESRYAAWRKACGLP